MSEFSDAISWRGRERPALIAYGLWHGKVAGSTLESISNNLTDIFPISEVSAFVAWDEDWPYSVGVFDIECSHLAQNMRKACKDILASVGAGGSRFSWMMFDGVFNSGRDIFCQDWAPHIYAINDGSGCGEIHLAIDDVLRHSAEWRRVVAFNRENLMNYLKCHETSDFLEDL